MKNRLLLVAAVLVIALFGLSCSKGDSPAAPTVVATPSPSPTPGDAEITSCKQNDLLLYLLNGAGNPDAVHDFRDYIPAQAAAVNAAGGTIEPTCYAEPKNSLTKIVGWSVNGPSCRALGNLTSFAIQIHCLDPGDIQVVATNGPFKAIWNGVLIRAGGIALPEYLPTGEALGLYTSYGADGRVLHQVRVSRERGIERIR